MSEVFKIFLTSGLTIIGGVLIYTIGQIGLKFFIDPIVEQKKAIGEVADALIFYDDLLIYHNENPLFTSSMSNASTSINARKIEAAQRLRNLANLLISRSYIIPFYTFFEKQNLLIKKSDIDNVCHDLIRLSNLIYKSSGTTTDYGFLGKNYSEDEMDESDLFRRIQTILNLNL